MDIDAESSTSVDLARKIAAVHEFLESPGAMAHGVFRARIDFAEGLRHAVGDEDRIIAEAVRCRAAERSSVPCTSPSKILRLAMRHGQRQGADEFGGKIRARSFRCNSRSTRAMAMRKSLAGPAQRAE